jgi:phospholipid/cholesterol/gamma-HCH transport system ATP-binding protein
MIQIRNLTVAFNDKIILDDLSLDIPESRTTVIVGPSGGGKSVLVKTIEGLIRPRSGKILIDGDDLFALSRTGLQQTRRKLSMLFQGAALFDSLTVFQNIALPLREHTKLTMDEITPIVAEKLALVGLPDAGDSMPADLSGGMRKRVGLARAIALEPRYIIYDEPTTGLDPAIAREINELIVHLKSTLDLTSIVITHDLECMEQVGERIVMLLNGKVAFEGTFGEFLDCPQPEILVYQEQWGRRRG